MKLALLLFATALMGCRSATTDPRTTMTPQVELNESARAALLGAVKALEGNWVGDQGLTEFSVSSGGSAVRELMFPGLPHEMTNMYTLDGNGLAMTHYCGAGNQPHMRATSIEDGRIEFEASGVSDLDATDGAYMGAMTLVIVDADHFEQHWTGMTMDGEVADDHAMVFQFARAR